MKPWHSSLETQDAKGAQLTLFRLNGDFVGFDQVIDVLIDILADQDLSFLGRVAESASPVHRIANHRKLKPVVITLSARRFLKPQTFNVVVAVKVRGAL